VPFLIATILFALARMDAMRLRPVALLALAALGVATVDAYGRYLQPLAQVSTGTWVPLAVHATGREIRSFAPEGKVLTLAPIVPLEAGLDIYRSLATGPFSWRTARLVDDDEREAFGIEGPADLDRIFAADPPAAVLLGYENDPEERLEEPIRRAAERHGYVAVPFATPSALLVREGAPSADAGRAQRAAREITARKEQP
jgi:hypothetical protein